MTLDDYTRIANALLTEAARIEVAKRPAYTIGSDDVLANFKRIGERTGLSPTQVLAVYFLKHIDAVMAALTQPETPQAEDLTGRFADAINYLKLGYALIQDLKPRTGLTEVDQKIPKRSRPPGVRAGARPTEPTPEVRVGQHVLTPEELLGLSAPSTTYGPGSENTPR